MFGFSQQPLTRRDAAPHRILRFRLPGAGGPDGRAGRGRDRRIRWLAKAPHFTPKAKRVIFMFMQGGPSHVDTFDYKPQLGVDDGKPAGQQGNNNGQPHVPEVALGVQAARPERPA